MRCPTCGHDNRASAKFCEECAQSLRLGGAPVQPDPLAFTPAHLAEKMRRERPSEGERRTVTVLFVDAVGSTPLAEKLGEEDMYSLMRGALSRMSEAVHAHEGHVATFTGDGMMALFGAPIAHEDSARRAVAAALGMQRSLDEYAEEVERRHGVDCRFRVGLNTGPVVVGTVTDDLRMDFTAIGDTVNLAARMEQLAEPGTVLVSEATHRAVVDFFEWEAVGDLEVKGKVGPVGAYRVLSEKSTRTRFEVAAERGLSPLVGRDRELAVLEAHVERARQGVGQVVFVSGEAGIGKSRLVLELRHRLENEAVGWLEGHCISYGASSAYLPVVDLLKKALGVEEGDDDAQIIGRVDEVVARWPKTAQKRAPYLKYLLSVDPGDAAVSAMDPQERRAEVFEALGALVVEESARRPLVVAVEDLHWADQMSQEALGALMAAVPAAPVLLVLTHRPGYDRPAGDFAVLDLKHLDEEESVALTRGVLGAEALPLEVQLLVTTKAEGNPFYIEEVSKALVESGVVARVNGSYQLQSPLEEIHIPGTIQEVILSRIDRLEREAKQSLQLASVIGREFTARLLGRISDLEAKLSEVLDELKTLELIHEKALFPELAYMFKHALTHDVAYATLLAERRRNLHRLVGAAIEELYQDRLAEHYEVLAHHYYEGRDWEKALDYMEKAGDKAVAAYANPDALGFYARALEVCEVLGEHAVPASASLAAKRGFVNFTIGDVPEAIGDFDRMLGVARRFGDRRLEGMALAFRGMSEWMGHDFEAAEKTLHAALALADDRFDDVRVVASIWLAALLLKDGRLNEVELPLQTAERLASRVQDPVSQAWVGIWRGLSAYWSGRFSEAVRVLEHWRKPAKHLVFTFALNEWTEALARASRGEYEQALSLLEDVMATCERLGARMVMERALNTVGWIHGELQDHFTALDWNARSLQVVDESEVRDIEVWCNALLNVGDNLLALGRLEEAYEQFRQVERVVRNPQPHERMGLWIYTQHFLHSYGELWLARGDSGRAVALANECLTLAERTDRKKNVIKARRLRGQALLAQGCRHEAEQDLSAALEVAIEVGNPPQLWKTHVAIGDLWQSEGKTEDAHRAFAEALSVIDGVAATLTDGRLRETFLESKHVQGIRRAAEARS